MLNLILQRMVPMITAFVVMLNGIGSVFGVVVVPYNPERVEVSLGSNVNSDIDEVLEYYNAAVKKQDLFSEKLLYITRTLILPMMISASLCRCILMS